MVKGKDLNLMSQQIVQDELKQVRREHSLEMLILSVFIDISYLEFQVSADLN